MKREEIKISMILFLSKNEDIIKNDAEKATDFLTKLPDTLKEAFPTLLFALIIFLLGILISKIIIKIINKFMKRSTVDDAAVSFLVSFIRIILYTIVIVSALTFLGVPMSSIITLIGAAGLAISLALQICLSNLAGGFIILFSKPFKSGDTIELDTSIGVVQSINILYTKIITFDNSIWNLSTVPDNCSIWKINEKNVILGKPSDYIEADITIENWKSEQFRKCFLEFIFSEILTKNKDNYSEEMFWDLSSAKKLTTIGISGYCNAKISDTNILSTVNL